MENEKQFSIEIISRIQGERRPVAGASAEALGDKTVENVRSSD